MASLRSLYRSFVEVEVAGTPGKVEFWPKGEDVWGPDSSVADYYVVIAQEEQVRSKITSFFR